ncbi:hypothetical protein K8Q94_00965 [Candidatus Nomurabacteria bacterium]|nr:hypothetical protein [Candidatus Nomurabacteria bacterium]
MTKFDSGFLKIASLVILLFLTYIQFSSSREKEASEEEKILIEKKIDSLQIKYKEFNQREEEIKLEIKNNNDSNTKNALALERLARANQQNSYAILKLNSRMETNEAEIRVFGEIISLYENYFHAMDSIKKSTPAVDSYKVIYYRQLPPG